MAGNVQTIWRKLNVTVPDYAANWVKQIYSRYEPWRMVTRVYGKDGRFMEFGDLMLRFRPKQPSGGASVGGGSPSAGWTPPGGTWPSGIPGGGQQGGSELRPIPLRGRRGQGPGLGRGGSYLVPPGQAYPPAVSPGVPDDITGISRPIYHPSQGQRPRLTGTMPTVSSQFIPGMGWIRTPSRPAPWLRAGMSPPSGQVRPFAASGGSPSGQAGGVGGDGRYSIRVTFPDPTKQGTAIDQQRWNEIRDRVAGIPNPFNVAISQLPGMRRTQSARALQEGQQIGEQLARQARAEGLSTLDYQRKMFEGSVGLNRANTFANLMQQLYGANTALQDLRREQAFAEMMRRLWLMGLFNR